jgi:outer membrane lipoprotein-sorting protein
MMIKRAFMVYIMTGLFVSSLVLASENRGLEIEKQRKLRDVGWKDCIARMKMILQNAQGDQSKRILKMSFLEVDHDGDKSLTVFEQPRDIKGSAFLSYSHTSGPDDQWLYLPALKRVKRISSSNKSGPFMGSEFSYEDLSSFEIEKFNFRFVKEEQLDGKTTFVVEQIPRDEYSGYTRELVWIEKSRYIPLKVEFYDRKNSLLKTLTYSDYKQYEGKYWRSLSMNMYNNQTHKSTRLITSKMVFNNGLNERDFDSKILRRIH